MTAKEKIIKIKQMFGMIETPVEKTEEEIAAEAKAAEEIRIAAEAEAEKIRLAAEEAEEIPAVEVEEIPAEEADTLETQVANLTERVTYIEDLLAELGVMYKAMGETNVSLQTAFDEHLKRFNEFAESPFIKTQEEKFNKDEDKPLSRVEALTEIQKMWK